MTSYDDIFETDESRVESQLERMQSIRLSVLVPFKGHPFKVVGDEAILQTTESIAQYDVLTPLIARPPEDDSCEIISGHRGAHTVELTGFIEVPVLVRRMDGDAATVLMVDSNLQKGNILPSERAYTYEMKDEAMKRQAGRPPKENGGQLDHNLFGRKTVEVIASESSDNVKQVQRFIRPTYLTPEVLDMVDQKQVSFNPAVELSYLKAEEREMFVQTMDEVRVAPSLSQAQHLKKLGQEGGFTLNAAKEIMNEVKKGDLERVTFWNEQLRRYFPRSYTTQQMQSTILKLLDQWQKKEGRNQER